MSKPFLLFRGPVKTRSGYGAHSRDLLESLFDMNEYDIKIDSCRWGVTPIVNLDKNNLFHNWLENNIISLENVMKQPDVYVQVTVPNEFNPIGKYNIGITAGIETTLAPEDWIDGINRMDLTITTSKFSSKVLTDTIYTNDNKLIKRVNKPVEVLFEGVDTNIYNNKKSNFELDVKEDFCYLFVGHWLRGVLGEDRKNVGMLIKCFAQAFANQSVGLILKTSYATFSVKDREQIRKSIEFLTKDIPNCPSIYLLHGDLTDEEMNDLYNHPKVKSMITITKGEGFGRPLLEFSMTGKPIIASNWSGHIDFLSLDKSILLGGMLTDVHESSVDQFVLKNAKWFTVNYNEVIEALLYVKNNYDKLLINSENLRRENLEKFSREKMTEEFKKILDKHVIIPKQVNIKLPKLIELND